ncbi:MAG: hypothetical protein EA424_27185 [Planctomycetaceae bacterium]|nr:MAG: hypothetical protein EA424_27185 [Planctomycetaceae bacterium]
MTLTELLVVILIMSLLLGISLPMMRTAVQDRALREASRQLNTYVQLAKAQAAERGRPVGLWLETERLPEGFPADTLFCQQLFLAETPPPYGGDVVGARIRVDSSVVSNDPDTNRPQYQAAFVQLSATPPPTMDQTVSSASFQFLVQQGDTIRFDFKGPRYRIIAIALPQITIEGEIHEPPPPTGDMQYQVFRSPQRSGVTPMAFSGDAVIDLSLSGIGLNGLELGQATSPIVIMFSPTGSIDRIVGRDLPVIRPGTVHLLIGSLRNMMEPGEGVPVFGEDYNRNLEETVNLWVSIGHQSGGVVSAQNAWEARTDFSESLAAAREFSEQRFAIGGR